MTFGAGVTSRVKSATLMNISETNRALARIYGSSSNLGNCCHVAEMRDNGVLNWFENNAKLIKAKFKVCTKSRNVKWKKPRKRLRSIVYAQQKRANQKCTSEPKWNTESWRTNDRRGRMKNREINSLTTCDDLPSVIRLGYLISAESVAGKSGKIYRAPGKSCRIKSSELNFNYAYPARANPLRFAQLWSFPSNRDFFTNSFLLWCTNSYIYLKIFHLVTFLGKIWGNRNSFSCFSLAISILKSLFFFTANDCSLGMLWS